MSKRQDWIAYYVCRISKKGQELLPMDERNIILQEIRSVSSDALGAKKDAEMLCVLDDIVWDFIRNMFNRNGIPNIQTFFEDQYRKMVRPESMPDDISDIELYAFEKCLNEHFWNRILDISNRYKLQYVERDKSGGKSERK